MELASVRRSVPYTRFPAQLVSLCFASPAERGAITGLEMADRSRRKVRLFTSLMDDIKRALAALGLLNLPRSIRCHVQPVPGKPRTIDDQEDQDQGGDQQVKQRSFHG